MPRRHRAARSNGEVTQTALSQAAFDTAFAAPAGPVSSIPRGSLTISHPPTQGEVQTVVDAFNALLAALQL